MMRFSCRRCDASRPIALDAPARCDCGGLFVATEPVATKPGEEPAGPRGAAWRRVAGAAETGDDAAPLATGATPRRPLPGLADVLGVEALAVKDEGANPTGSVRDRSAVADVAVARAAGSDGVATAAAGEAGVAVAAHAARADIDASIYLPSRARFDDKAAVNVHGADMTVVRGRLSDARATADDAGARDVSPGATPFGHDALAAVGAELAGRVDEGPGDRQATPPDHVVVPLSDGGLTVGLDVGLPDDVTLHGVQPAGCAPIVDAVDGTDHGAGSPPAVDDPDTVVGECEDPEPPLGAAASAVVATRNGGAVAVEDDPTLDAGVAAARRDGWLPSLAGAVALAGCETLSDRFDEGDAVTVVDPGFGRVDVDGFRSQLMGRGE